KTYADVEALEIAIVDARPLSAQINDWESRWPLGSFHVRDASKLSRAMLDRVARAQAMQPSHYRAALIERDRVRMFYGKLAAHCDGCLTLTAPAAARTEPAAWTSTYRFCRWRC